MSFEEMQAILQGILLSQQQFQSEIAETNAALDRSIAAADRSMEVADRSIEVADRSIEVADRSIAVADRAMATADHAMVTADHAMAIADRAMVTADRAMATADRAAQIAESNGRTIQAMLDQAATDRLEEQERARRHEEEMRELRAINRGLVNLAVSIDEDRPTILRLLNSNNSKLDAILDRLPPTQQ
jgi:hypothetical protein